MSFDSSDESRESAESTLGVLVSQGQVRHAARGAASRSPPAVGPRGLAGCADTGVLHIGLDGGHALYTERSRAVVPRAMARAFVGSHAGTAAAIHHHLPLVKQLAPVLVFVQIGDHGDEVDYRAMLSTHAQAQLGATVGCIEISAEIARGFAVLGTDARGRVVRCAHRPRRPQRLPGDPARSLIAADLYVFDLEPLVDCLAVDAADPGSSHDLCRDVLPLLVRAGELGSHVFEEPALVSRYVPK
jgi:ADP-glucose pyrophosphorylase